jgi:iron(III) transport system substrate-binding protein
MRKKPMRRRLRSIALVSAFALLPAGVSAAAEVNLYTTREPGLIEPLLKSFTEKSGVKVNTLFVKEGLAERVIAEGEHSPADVLMTVDFGNLVDLVDQGATQPVKSAALESAVPANLRDPDGRWFALSLRARLVYAAKDRVSDEAITYEDLADPKWKGRICSRSGQHPYNTALIATVIAKDGPAAAETWLAGMKDNLARKPAGGDRDVARDILGGICDIGLGNSYYVGLMRSGKGGDDQKKWGDAINVIIPTFKSGGTHVNISGAAIARHAPNRDDAIRLLEFFVSDEAQQLYANANYEYPVKPGIAADPIIAELGPLTVDATTLNEIAANRKAAAELVDKVGYDN